jgi:DNA-directed RNA polymerase specialized sigma24 family protein
MNSNPGESSPHSSDKDRRYEQAVTEIRACLRQNDTTGAHRRFAELTAALLPYITKRAEASLHRYQREMPEEGIALALRELWDRISDFETHSGTLHLERRFFQAFKLLLSDAFKKARTEKYGLTQKDGPLERLDTEAFTTEEESSKVSEIYEAPDYAAEDAFYTPWSQGTAASLLARVPDSRWAVALRMEADGYDREEIAAHFGVSVKSINTWTRQAKAILKVYLLETYPLDSRGNPIL